MMTPKEKAKELFEKMYEYAIFDEAAKQCALIAVDEVIKHLIPDNSFPGYNEWFWEEVKKEIETL